MATSAGALREMNFMFHLFGRYGRVGRCGVPLVLGLDHPGHHHIQTNPTCLYAQSSGPAPLPLFPAPGPVSLASVWVPPCPGADSRTFRSHSPAVSARPSHRFATESNTSKRSSGSRRRIRPLMRGGVMCGALKISRSGLRGRRLARAPDARARRTPRPVGQGTAFNRGYDYCRVRCGFRIPSPCAGLMVHRRARLARVNP